MTKGGVWVCRVFDSIEPEAQRAEGEGFEFARGGKDEGKGGVKGFEFARGGKDEGKGG
jgi:hypothetical protein